MRVVVGQLVVIGDLHLTGYRIVGMSSPRGSESDSDWSLVHTEPSPSLTPTQSLAPTRAPTPTLNTEPTPSLTPSVDKSQVLRSWRRFVLRRMIGRHWSNLGNMLKQAKTSASKISA